MWYPPSMWEAHGFPYDAYTRKDGWHPGAEVVCERFCAHCACSQRTDEDEPCWQCGEATQPEKPDFWPTASSSVTVRNGDSWSPGREET